MTRLLPHLAPLFAIAVMTNLAMASSSSSELLPKDPFTSDQVLTLIRESCNVESLFCPSEKYLVKAGEHRFFNPVKVMKSKKFHVFKSGAISKDDMIPFFRDEYCCTVGSCLEQCNIYQLNEKSIIVNFPKIYKDIFALGIEELKPYEKMYEHYLKHHHRGHKKPAEIEELFDLLHYNGDDYLAALAQKNEKKD